MIEATRAQGHEVAPPEGPDPDRWAVTGAAFAYVDQAHRAGFRLVDGECIRAGCHVRIEGVPWFCEACEADVVRAVDSTSGPFWAALASREAGGRAPGSWDEADTAWRAGLCRVAAGYRPVVQPSVAHARTGVALDAYRVPGDWQPPVTGEAAAVDGEGRARLDAGPTGPAGSHRGDGGQVRDLVEAEVSRAVAVATVELRAEAEAARAELVAELGREVRTGRLVVVDSQGRERVSTLIDEDGAGLAVRSRSGDEAVTLTAEDHRPAASVQVHVGGNQVAGLGGGEHLDGVSAWVNLLTTVGIEAEGQPEDVVRSWLSLEDADQPADLYPAFLAALERAHREAAVATEAAGTDPDELGPLRAVLAALDAGDLERVRSFVVELQAGAGR